MIKSEKTNKKGYRAGYVLIILNLNKVRFIV